MKKQTYDLEERLLEYSVRIIKVVECSLLRVFFHSTLDVRCSMLDVHLFLHPYMKLHQSGTVSFSIKLAAFQASGWAEL